jgi:hypothetical protein
MGSGVLGFVKGAAASDPSHAFSSHVDAVGVVDEAVENGVGQGRIADNFVPLVGGDLAGDDGGTAPVTVFEYLEQIDALSVCEDRQSPIVEDQQIDAAEHFEGAGVPPIAACERQGFEQARDTLIEDGATVATSLVAECAA